MDGRCLNIKQDILNKLKELIPNCFTEDKIDWEKLKVFLEDNIEFRNERYHLNWAGKTNAFRLLQSPTYQTLKPCREKSVNFDETENLFIEGDNLEVLKILQKSYFGKIKMIYIDPPYNTGNDFIYKDDYSETLAEYKRKVGDVDENGNATRAGLFRNTKENGQYHSNWLNMMYPRLFLARNLLRDDGVIFVSIDDNEVHNLRLLMDEIFGEENFVAIVISSLNPRGKQSMEHLAITHEYLICYAKNISVIGIGLKPLNEQQLKEYHEVDENGKRYRLIGLRKRGAGARREDVPSLFYPIYYNPTTKEISLQKITQDDIEILPKMEDGTLGRWRWSKIKVEKDKNILVVKKVRRKIRIEEFDVFEKN